MDPSLEHNTQVRCRHCATGWISVNSQEDVPTPSQKRCEACLRKSHSQRAERRARDPKPMGRPPKQVLRKSNRDRKPKSDLRDRFGDSLYVTAQIEDNDGDELAAQPPPAIRPRGRPRGRAWGPPPTQRPNTGGRRTMEPSPELPTRLSTRHTRRGSELAPPPKRLKPPHDVMSSPDPLGPSSQPHPIELMDSSADPLQFLAPTAVQHGVTVRREGEGENEEEEDSDEDREEGDEEESPTRRRGDPDWSLGNRVTRRSNRATSRGRPRATSIDSSPQGTPRRPLRNRSVRNPSSIPRPIPTRAAEQKPKYYNSEFRKRDTQRHHLGDRTIMCPHCHAYMWKDELPAGGSVLNPSFEVCCRHGKIKMPPNTDLFLPCYATSISAMIHVPRSS